MTQSAHGKPCADCVNTQLPRWGYEGEECSDLIGLTSYPVLFRPVGTFFKSLLSVLLI